MNALGGGVRACAESILYARYACGVWLLLLSLPYLLSAISPPPPLDYFQAAKFSFVSARTFYMLAHIHAGSFAGWFTLGCSYIICFFLRITLHTFMNAFTGRIVTLRPLGL